MPRKKMPPNSAKGAKITGYRSLKLRSGFSMYVFEIVDDKLEKRNVYLNEYEFEAVRDKAPYVEYLGSRESVDNEC